MAFRLRAWVVQGFERHLFMSVILVMQLNLKPEESQTQEIGFEKIYGEDHLLE